MESRSLICPRDGTSLSGHSVQGIHVDRCESCGGFWLDPNELDELESTRVDEDTRRGTIEFAQRTSELNCPVCAQPMRAFNYRAYNLELETCDEHGYWLDHGEDHQVLEIVEERRRGLRRSPRAEAGWQDIRRGGGGGFTDRIRRFFGM